MKLLLGDNSAAAGCSFGHICTTQRVALFRPGTLLSFPPLRTVFSLHLSGHHTRPVDRLLPHSELTNSFPASLRSAQYSVYIFADKTS